MGGRGEQDRCSGGGNRPDVARRNILNHHSQESQPLHEVHINIISFIYCNMPPVRMCAMLHACAVCLYAECAHVLTSREIDMDHMFTHTEMLLVSPVRLTASSLCPHHHSCTENGHQIASWTTWRTLGPEPRPGVTIQSSHAEQGGE